MVFNDINLFEVKEDSLEQRDIPLQISIIKRKKKGKFWEFSVVKERSKNLPDSYFLEEWLSKTDETLSLE